MAFWFYQIFIRFRFVQDTVDTCLLEDDTVFFQR